MAPLRSPSWCTAACVLVLSMTAAAQTRPEDKLEVEREVVMTGEPGERPAVVYGAANIGVQLFFEAPLQRTDAGIALKLSGVDVRPHPYLDNALVLTPSSALASGPMVPLRVTLVDGGVPLLLTFQPGRVDHALRILQRPRVLDAGTGVSRAALQELLSSTAGAIFKDDACAVLPSQSVQVSPVTQYRSNDRPEALVCSTGTFNYVRIPRTNPGCPVASARLLRGGTDMEVLLLKSVRRSENGSWQVLAVWSPPKRTKGFELWLLAAEGTLCENYFDLTLGPRNSP